MGNQEGEDTERRATEATSSSGVSRDPHPTDSKWVDPDPGASVPDATVTTGQLLGGRYRLERELGSGGMGIVYFASDQEVKGETFAIKVLRPEIRNRPDVLALMREEVRKTRSLGHPNIVGVYSLNSDSAGIYMLMEYLEGTTLRDLIDYEFSRGMPFGRAWPLIQDIGAALSHAHDHNLIHSDIKPSNVFVTKAGRGKLLDFGIARAARGRVRETGSGALVALTPAYASCEMLEGLESDSRDDVYALGCVIYEMLSGRHPFDGKSAIEARDGGLRPQPIASLTRGQNVALAKALAFKRGDRTESVEKLLAGLARSNGSNTVVAAGVGIVALIALIGGAIAWTQSHRAIQPVVNTQAAPESNSTSATIPAKSIAVLPFADMSEKKDQEYFADGMAEEILDLLAKIPGLTVIGRTSSFQFKGKNADLRAIGTQLNAAHVLEGSVRRSGDQVRITAQLISTRTGAHEWSETYDRHIGDVLKLQDAIAAAVVRELQLTVASGYLNSRTTLKDADVYDLMLRARHAADRYDKDGLDEAVTLFQRALDRDATSADAAAELASTYETQGEWGFLAPAAAFEQARSTAATALRLDPKNALAHFVLGEVRFVYDWDWAAAEREFHQAATLAPGRADVLNGEATLSLALGRSDEALRQIKAALSQDPLDAGTLNTLSDIQARRGHLPEAEAARRRALDIRPNAAWGHYYLGRIVLALGDREAALLEMQQETDEAGKQPGLAMVYYALGRKTDSDAALARMLKEQADGNAFGIAEVYAFRGQSDEAMHWLERAYAQKDSGLSYIKGDLPLKNLEADLRYKAFLRKMNLPE
jgi:TolB-like protein